MFTVIIWFISLTQLLHPSTAAVTKNQFRRCVQHSHATKADVALIRRKDLPESLTSKYLLSCILEVEGVMTKGVYNSNIGRKIGSKAYPKNQEKSNKALQILQDCGEKDMKIKDPCEAAYQLALCTTSLSEQMKL